MEKLTADGTKDIAKKRVAADSRPHHMVWDPLERSSNFSRLLSTAEIFPRVQVNHHRQETAPSKLASHAEPQGIFLDGSIPGKRTRFL